MNGMIITTEKTAGNLIPLLTNLSIHKSYIKQEKNVFQWEVVQSSFNFVVVLNTKN